jgi:hypothetical protein
MKGPIVQCFQELVTNRFGKDKWEKSLTAVGLDPRTRFLPIQNVDDSAVMALLEAVCKQVGLSMSEIADAFGEYWVADYSQRLYSHFYSKYSSAREFLQGMDEVHVSMTQNIEGAMPPRFDYTWEGDNTLLMHYKSHRPLIDFVVGLAKGVGKYFNEHLEVTKVDDHTVQIVFL